MYEQNTTNAAPETDGPVRPPTFGESQNERTIPYPEADYPAAPELDDEPPLRVTVDNDLSPKRENTHWAPNQFFVDSSRNVQIVGRDLMRRRLLLLNNDATNPVYLVRDATSPTWAGYKLPAGATLELWHNDSVWAICDATESAVLSIASEFTLQE